MSKTPKKSANARKRRWSAEVTKHSDALDLEDDVFRSKDPRKDRAFVEKLRRTERPAQKHALSIRDVDVEFLHQSSGKNLQKKQKRILENAKQELRDVFGRA